MTDTKQKGNTGFPMGLTALLAAGLFVALALTGCSMALGGSGSDTTPWVASIPAGFDFALERSITINADIQVKFDGSSQPYAGQLGVYSYDLDTNAYTLLGSGLLGSDGKGSFDVVVPTSLTSVTVKPAILGLFERDISIDPSTKTIDLTVRPEDVAKAVIAGAQAGSKALVPSSGKSVYQTVSSFDSQGVPADINTNGASKLAFSLSFLNDLSTSLPEYKSLPASNPAFVDLKGLSTIAIKENNASVILTFISEGAAYRNSLGYFVYDTATPPASASAIPAADMVIAFPNTSFVGSGGNLQAGDSIALLNPRTKTNIFNKGLSIGWFLIANGFNGNVGNGMYKFYSIPGINPEPATGNIIDKTHIAFLRNYSNVDAGTISFVLSFEDMYRPNADNDFNDAIFAVNVTPDTAVDATGVPNLKTLTDSDKDGVPDSSDEYPNDPARAYNVYWPSATAYGTAIFEDRWPSVGDYDFNDLVANLRTKTVKNAKGEAVEMYIDTRLLAAGAGFPSGLALSLPVASSYISSVTRDQVLKSGPFSPGSNGVESDGSNSIIPILSNSHVEFGVSGNSDLIVNTKRGGVSKDARDYAIKVSFASGLSASTLTATPDLFIVTNNSRGQEIHAIGKNPTSKANLSLFNTSNDASKPNAYYRSSTGAPWALIVPAEMPWALEQEEISGAYLKFKTWVSTGGTKYSDWYLEKTGYRNPAYLY